jgi:hypothetical protein
MRNRIALALIPLALFSMAAKGGCGGDLEPIVPVDAGTADTGTGDCPIPEPTCPAGEAYSVANCACEPTTTTGTPDAGCPLIQPTCPPGTSYSVPACACEPPSDCPIPEPACPPGTAYSVANCACEPTTTTGTADASIGSDCPIPEPACPPGTSYFIPDCACEPTIGTDASIGSDCPIPEPTCPPGTSYFIPDCACEPTGSGPDAALSCSQLTTESQNAVATAVSPGADVSCTTAADCVVASNSTSCFNGCGVVVNQAGAAALQAAIAQINSTTCATFVADGCVPNTPPPCAPTIPSCVNSVCSD